MSQTLAHNGFLAPDGELFTCAEYGHSYLAKALYDERPDVQRAYEDVECDMVAGDLGLPVIPSLLNAALERAGFLKLATRRGTSDWSYWHGLTRITQQQFEALLAWHRDASMPLPSWLDRETLRLL